MTLRARDSASLPFRRPSRARSGQCYLCSLARRFYRARLYEGPLPLPGLGTNGLGLQSGGFSFNLSGVAGQTIIIEASTNLPSANWTALATNTLSTGPLYFADPDWTNTPRRFYRVRLQ